MHIQRSNHGTPGHYLPRHNLGGRQQGSVDYFRELFYQFRGIVWNVELPSLPHTFRLVLSLLSTMACSFLLLTPSASAAHAGGSEESEEVQKNAYQGPEFEFKCIGEEPTNAGDFNIPSGPSGIGQNSQLIRQEQTNHRPDMPSGDLEKEVYCWIENPNDYNITVQLSFPSVLSVYDLDYVNCQVPYDWYWSGYCSYGRWLIIDGGQSEFELEPFEMVGQNWSFSLGPEMASMPPGINSIDISAKVTEYGDGGLECPDSCSTIIQSSNHVLGSWWKIDWDAGYFQDGLHCGYHYSVAYYPSSQISDCNLELGGLEQDVYVSDLWRFCTTYQKYGPPEYYQGTEWGSGQWVTTCEPSIESSWQHLFLSSELDQALIFHAGFDERNMGADISDIKPGYWNSAECPSNSIDYILAPNYQGNVPPPDIWQVDVVVRGYSFSEDSWWNNVSSSQLLKLSDLLESNETGTVIGINLEEILAGAEHDYIFIEWILREGDSEFTSGIIGECLTKSGILAMEEVVENAKFTMGQSGNTVERMTNTVKFSLAVNGMPPILLFLGALAITVLFVFMTMFYRGKPAREASPSEDSKDKPVPVSADSSTQGSIGGSQEHQNNTSTFWTIVWVVCFIFPPLLLLAGPVYLATRSPKVAHPGDESNYSPADQGEFGIPSPIREAPPENEASDQSDVPWWEIDKLI